MMHSRRTDASPFATAAMVAAMIAAAAPDARAESDLPPIVPHRAIYDLSLDDAEERTGIAGASGRMAIELAAAGCEGWTVNIRIVNRLNTREGDTRTIDSRSSSWESADGETMAFTLSRYIQNSLELETKGLAKRGGDGEPGHVTLEQPEQTEFDLPPDVIFPVEHTRRILATAMAGERREESLVYDGSEERKVYQTITFVGTRKEPGAAELPGGVQGVDRLEPLASWPVSISYFEGSEKTGEATPSHQVSFTMFENGVASGISLDYGDFALTGDLTTLEFLDDPECPGR